MFIHVLFSRLCLQRDRGREKEREKAIFGDAKPVDTASREREIEERLKRKEEDFKKKLRKTPEKEGSQRGSRYYDNQGK